MQVVQTAEVPPSTGSAIFANMGSIQKSSAALTKRVREKMASERDLECAAATGCVVAILPVASGSLSGSRLRGRDQFTGFPRIRGAAEVRIGLRLKLEGSRLVE